MKYITKDEVRNLTGLTEVEVNDSQLERIIDDAENFVDAYTDKSWSTSDGNYALPRDQRRPLRDAVPEPQEPSRTP